MFDLVFTQDSQFHAFHAASCNLKSATDRRFRESRVQASAKGKAIRPSTVLLTKPIGLAYCAFHMHCHRDKGRKESASFRTMSSTPVPYRFHFDHGKTTGRGTWFSIQVKYQVYPSTDLRLLYPFIHMHSHRYPPGRVCIHTI